MRNCQLFMHRGSWLLVSFRYGSLIDLALFAVVLQPRVFMAILQRLLSSTSIHSSLSLISKYKVNSKYGIS